MKNRELVNFNINTIYGLKLKETKEVLYFKSEADRTHAMNLMQVHHETQSETFEITLH